VRRGPARQGTARLGVTRHDKARQGEVQHSQARLGIAWPDEARHDKARFFQISAQNIFRLRRKILHTKTVSLLYLIINFSYRRLLCVLVNYLQ